MMPKGEKSLNITELRYLVAIMQWGSVSAAAKQLYAAQPNISKALKNLEEEYKIRIFERSSTGMIPTEQGRRFIEQAERVLEDVDLLSRSVEEEQERCAELRVMLPHATYASYAAVDYLEQAAHLEKMHIHIREGGSMEALDFVLRRGYHLALLRYAMEDDEHYSHYCARRGLKMEPVMDFEYQLLTNRRIHVYERCSQFSILQRLPTAYMWASPMPRKALEQYHLVLRKCPAQRQQMRDVLVYPDKGSLRAEEQAFVDLLQKQAAQTVK